MILAIAKKEFLENVLSRKFLVAVILSVIILGTGVFAMSRAYEEKKSYYDTQIEEYEQTLEEGTGGYESTAEAAVYQAIENPNPLTTLISGEALGQTGMGEIRSMLNTSESTTSPLWDRFGMLDLTFIVGFLMSLMAVIFSYDSISGEKEHGTLKLTLTNDIPKDHVLLGKYIGGTASVLLPFVIAMVLALGIVAIAGGVPYTMSDYGTIGILVLIGCATISAFYLLGLFVSSITKRSAISMLVVLFIWIFLVQGIGNVASLTATETTSGMTYDEYRDEYMSISQEVMQQYGRENMQQAMAEIQARWDALTIEYTSQQEAQLNTALGVARISPTESYRNVAQALAGLSWEEGVHISEQISDYEAALEEEYNEWRAEQMQQQMQQAAPDNFPSGPTGGQGNPFQQAEFSENFEAQAELEYYYEPWGTSERLSTAVYDIVAIIMFNVLMFIGAYVAFVRYDVR